MALVDLTSLYHARQKGRTTDYASLDSALNNKLGKVLFQGYTSYAASNVGQEAFLQTLDGLGWTVDKYNARDIPADDKLNYRFNVAIAYELGSIVNSEEYEAVVVISDSLDLIPVMIDAANYLSVYLSFYGELLDKRWYKILLGESKIKFLDIDSL